MYRPGLSREILWKMIQILVDLKQTYWNAVVLLWTSSDSLMPQSCIYPSMWFGNIACVSSRVFVLSTAVS